MKYTIFTANPQMWEVLYGEEEEEEIEWFTPKSAEDIEDIENILADLGGPQTNRESFERL